MDFKFGVQTMISIILFARQIKWDRQTPTHRGQTKVGGTDKFLYKCDNPVIEVGGTNKFLYKCDNLVIIERTGDGR